MDLKKKRYLQGGVVGAMAGMMVGGYVPWPEHGLQGMQDDFNGAPVARGQAIIARTTQAMKDGGLPEFFRIVNAMGPGPQRMNLGWHAKSLEDKQNTDERGHMKVERLTPDGKLNIDQESLVAAFHERVAKSAEVEPWNAPSLIVCGGLIGGMLGFVVGSGLVRRYQERQDKKKKKAEAGPGAELVA